MSKIVLLLMCFASSAYAKTVRYELTAELKPINLSGKATVDFALSINGSIPAPVLEFTEGDDAEILVRNRIPGEEVSIHWHGILLPPEMDGVSYVNTAPIFSGKDHLFKFKIRQHGTYWYHSHTNIQEQKGLFGAIVIHPRKKTIPAERDVVVVLSDWSDENPTEILKNIRKEGHYYMYKKGTVRSWWGAFQAGRLGVFLNDEFTRMGGMDVSDIGYDAFLANGKRDSQLVEAQPGQRIRVRIINAAASSYFYLGFGGQNMKVIASDGMDVDPVDAKEILIGMAETYDLLVELPEPKNYQLLATSQDGTGSASVWIGKGDKVFAPVKTLPGLYEPMDHGSHGGGHGGGHEAHSMPSSTKSEVDHSAHDHGAMMNSMKPASGLRMVQTLGVDELKSKDSTVLSQLSKRELNLKLVLNGDMNRYVWHINGKAIFEDRNILIREGDLVRFELVNESMMHHPMHLHGHFFRVLNQFGDLSPLKHTVDVPPFATRTIEFLANEPGEWMLHCHNLYHMKNGMSRVVKYESFKPSAEIEKWQNQDPHLHDHGYLRGKLAAATNHAELKLEWLKTWSTIEFKVEAVNEATKAFNFDEEWHGEANLYYRRWVGEYLNLFAGARGDQHEQGLAIGGFYMLPFLIGSELVIDSVQKWSLQLSKEFHLTTSVMAEMEYKFSGSLVESEELSGETKLSLFYHPQWEWGAGLVIHDGVVGLGGEWKF
jgi:FtsP/CotA-like multicopper oxidase with cupredoxin domain